MPKMIMKLLILTLRISKLSTRKPKHPLPNRAHPSKAKSIKPVVTIKSRVKCKIRIKGTIELVNPEMIGKLCKLWPAQKWWQSRALTVDTGSMERIKSRQDPRSLTWAMLWLLSLIRSPQTLSWSPTDNAQKLSKFEKQKNNLIKLR